MALHLPIGPLKTCSGLEPVPRCEPSTYMFLCVLISFFLLQGKSEFIGRALCKPVVKLSDENYSAPKFPPRLEWWGVYRGPDRAGELLATFELLQVITIICLILKTKTNYWHGN